MHDRDQTRKNATKGKPAWPRRYISRKRDPNETRVAGSAETVKKFIALGFDVVVEKGAGEKSRIPDAEFAAAGARIGTAVDAKTADVILKVRRPGDAELKAYKSGAALFAMLDPYGHEDAVAALARAGISALRWNSCRA